MPMPAESKEPELPLIERFGRALAQLVRDERPDALRRPVTVAELYQDIAPYRRMRDLAGIELHADYEHALLRVLAGENDYARLEPDTAREELALEADAVDPNLSAYRKFAACDVWLSGEALPLGPATKPRPPAPPAEPLVRASPAPAPPAREDDGPPVPVGPRTSTPVPARPPERPTPAASAPPAPPAAAAAGETSGCGFCGRSLPADREIRYCPFCGADQAPRHCAECGEDLEEGWRYCVACGASAQR